MCKADTNSSDESLRRAVNHLENCLNAQEDAATETGFIWVPQFSKASMLDYFGQSEDVRSFCKFEISLSQDIGDNAVLCTPKPTDLKIKSDYLLGIIKLCSKENHLSIVATFKISKPNFI